MTAAHETFDSLIHFAHVFADAAGQAILPHFRQPITVDNKAGPETFDPVTFADKEAERVISELIERDLPDHGMIGEEFGSRGSSARYRWVIDPIDGTRSFIMGLPIWGTLIGLLEGGSPLLGVMDQPFTQERFWSQKQHSMMSVGRSDPVRINTRSCAGFEDAILSTTHPDLIAAGVETEAFLRLKRQVRMTRYGGDCYAYCLLAAGYIDIIVETGLKPYDVVALIPIVERAGGRMTTWDGGSAASGGRIIACGDPRLHEKAMKVLAG